MTARKCLLIALVIASTPLWILAGMIIGLCLLGLTLFAAVSAD